MQFNRVIPKFLGAYIEHSTTSLAHRRFKTLKKLKRNIWNKLLFFQNLNSVVQAIQKFVTESQKTGFPIPFSANQVQTYYRIAIKQLLVLSFLIKAKIVPYKKALYCFFSKEVGTALKNKRIYHISITEERETYHINMQKC